MEDNYEKVCLITGAGAIENAWKPIIRISDNGVWFVDAVPIQYIILQYETQFSDR